MSFNIENIVTADTTIVWLRRDLRLQDNAALYHALQENEEVLPLFIFDTGILDDLEDTDDPRVTFIHHSLFLLKVELEKIGSSLLVMHGRPADCFERLHPKSVYANNDYEPYSIKRDKKVADLLQKKSVPLKMFKDQVIFEKDEIQKDSGGPYTVFTPYSRKWKAAINRFCLQSYPVKKYHQHLKKCKPLPFPDLESIGFRKSSVGFPERVVRSAVVSRYDEQRNFPALKGTTRLSIHLRFGTVSIRTLARLAVRINPVWLNELIWRDFYQMILWNFPHVVANAFKPAYDKIEWRNDESEFSRWCEGKTGYPIVDAGMRELNTTGFMHNRVRMIAASFLTKHLLIDWRWGEAYFAKKLLDFDLAANNGGWQWAAGSGCDAAPYFRIFNPTIQTQKFDPDQKYIRTWVPELNTANYPAPMVDHSFARDRALRVYKYSLAQ